MQQALRRILQSRFGALPPDVEARLANLTLDEVECTLEGKRE
ncbi:MAG: hypothetical protein HC884_12020 [Chloroflexaceae bacterium]|nr:hypothetical protein [Chloroflexaceae bacterium]